MRFSCLLLACGLLTGPAAATPLVIDFAFSTTGRNAVLDGARDAGIKILESNYGAYGYDGDGLVLGNDGLSNWAALKAQTNLVFDALTVDLRSLHGVLEVLSCDGVDSFPDPYFPGYTVRCDEDDAVYYYDTLAALSPPMVRKPDLIFEGYRNGPDPVARVVLENWNGGVIDIAALGDFTALTRLDLSITQTGYDFLFDADRNAWISCRGGLDCGVAVIDSLSLDVRSAAGPGSPAPVPLPPSVLLSAAGVAGLGWLRRRSA